MKKIIAGSLAIISYLCSGVSCIWAIVSFLIYLVKDKPFNWWSIWSVIICFVFAVIMIFITAFISNKEKTPMKSRFQERLKEMEKQRKTKNP